MEKRKRGRPRKKADTIQPWQFVRAGVAMLQAKGKRWNAATKSWETFEDYGTQLAAVKEAARILGLYPTQKELEGRHKPHETIIRVVYEQPLKSYTYLYSILI